MKHTVAIYMVHRNGDGEMYELAPDLEIEMREFEDERRAHDYAGVLNAITCQMLSRYRDGKYVAVVTKGKPGSFYEERYNDRNDAILRELEEGVRARVDELFTNEKPDDSRRGIGTRLRSLFARGENQGG